MNFAVSTTGLLSASLPVSLVCRAISDFEIVEFLNAPLEELTAAESFDFSEHAQPASSFRATHLGEKPLLWIEPHPLLPQQALLGATF